MILNYLYQPEIMLSRVSRRLLTKFCTSQTVQQANTSSSVIETPKSNEVPVYLRPYDRTKYQTPLQKIKLNSGYAFLDVEPFPRAKIMKTCYHIMEQLSIGFPQDCIYRIFNEERTKYLMKIVDQTPDIEELEDLLGVETIELWIDNLVKQLEVIKIMRHSKIWELEKNEEYDPFFMDDVVPKPDQKFPQYKKPERPKSSFLDE